MWARMHGDKEGFTRQHWGARAGIPASPSRIDHIFATDKVANSTSEVGIPVGANPIESDHRRLVLGLDLRALTGRVPEMWGKNDDHLQSSEERVIESVKGLHWDSCAEHMENRSKGGRGLAQNWRARVGHRQKAR